MTKRLLFERGMGDVSDPEVYASGVVYEWEQTDAGKWAKKHVKDKLLWYTNDLDPSWESDYANGWGKDYAIVYRVRVFGDMTDKNYTYYSLKWGDPR